MEFRKTTKLIEKEIRFVVTRSCGGRGDWVKILKSYQFAVAR